MTRDIKTFVSNATGFIVLNRPKALNSLSLDMIRAITAALQSWRDDAGVRAVVIRGSGEKAFCAGGDIRFFHEVGRATPQQGSALLEDFFTEEYALNHLIHHYPKPYVALMDGIVMGGGMGVAQAGPQARLRIVTERTRMAMPEVHIGLFPDVGGSYFLSRAPGQVGSFLGVTGETIGAADALYAGLADEYVPSEHLGDLIAQLESRDSADNDVRATIRAFAAPYRAQVNPDSSTLAQQRVLIDLHFAYHSVAEIATSLENTADPFARKALDLMKQRSPLMMCVTLSQLRRGATMTFADCLRMERGMVRRAFEQGEVLEGIRARVIDKDNLPRWVAPALADVASEMTDRFFDSPWPAHAHPLRHLTA
jgi:enoyl-CoA hydratase/carnithine racemase